MCYQNGNVLAKGASVTKNHISMEKFDTRLEIFLKKHSVVWMILEETQLKLTRMNVLILKSNRLNRVRQQCGKIIKKLW